MMDKEYYARGCTALLDAIGKTMSAVINRRKTAPDIMKPSKTMFVIITDGYENASSEYDLQTVKKMIEHQKKEYDWEFLFLDVNIDADATSATYGISLAYDDQDVQQRTLYRYKEKQTEN